MRYLLLLLLLTCGHPEVEEEIRERVLIITVCYNPESAWHLSECNDQCERRNYNGDAYCLPLFDVMCEQSSTDPFITQACGFYYE
tara:strand:+ start:850 stop:1104 length:255 start_codon:yes stop_codon:yes gene_type:complete